MIKYFEVNKCINFWTFFIKVTFHNHSFILLKHVDITWWKSEQSAWSDVQNLPKSQRVDGSITKQNVSDATEPYFVTAG